MLILWDTASVLGCSGPRRPVCEADRGGGHHSSGGAGKAYPEEEGEAPSGSLRGEFSPRVTVSQWWRQNLTQFAHSCAPSLASLGRRPSVITDHTDQDLRLLGSERPFSDPVYSLRGWRPWSDCFQPQRFSAQREQQLVSRWLL